MSHIVIEKEIAGRTLRMETGKLAKLSDATVIVSYGETTVLAAVVRGAPREGIDFFPLQVDYRERISAAGKFPGGFRKREGAPSTKEILTMRNIDRPLRPLFPDGLRDEVLIQCWVESADGENDPDVVAAIAAQAAVAISSVPHMGPLASVRIGLIEDSFVINPTHTELQYSDMDLLLSGHKDGINMIEVGAYEVEEAKVLEAIKFGHGVILDILPMINELVEKAGKEKVAELQGPSEAILEKVFTLQPQVLEACKIPGKQDRGEALSKIRDEFIDGTEPMPGEDDDVSYTKYLAIKGRRAEMKEAFGTLEKKCIRKLILDEGYRSDGRGAEDLRNISAEIDVLARTHGSAVFTRGETQSLATVTLGVGRDEQIIDGLHEEYRQKFYLHYNFPPFCVGEARRITGPSRREIGHGALAERSLAPIVPDVEDFPYTIRVVSDILESNGSSSMASICGGCIAMMAAGVPIKNTTAGISIGMVSDGDQKILLTDILGSEDHFGDMDFKVAGSRKGITGIQLDLKAYGLDCDLVEEVFARAREARIKIIETMESVLPAPREITSDYAPRILTTRIDPEKIGKLIGPGGKMIRSIEEESGATIEIEEDGLVTLSAVGAGKAEKALEIVEALCEEVKVGKSYDGKVSSVKDFGAFVEVIPGQDGLLHISEISEGYIKSINDVVKIGDALRVKVIDKDEQGRLRLSRKVLEKEEGLEPLPGVLEERPPREERGDRGDRGRGGDRNRGGGRGGDRRGGGRGRDNRNRGGNRDGGSHDGGGKKDGGNEGGRDVNAGGYEGTEE